MIESVGSLDDAFDAQYRSGLRRWRRNFAREHEVDAFKVMWDVTLEAIIREKPTTKRALAAIFVNGADAWHLDDLWEEVRKLNQSSARRLKRKFEGYTLHQSPIPYASSSVIECPGCAQDDELTARERGSDHIRMTCERCMLEVVRLTQ